VTNTSDPGAPPPDAHLRAALQSAPDRDLQPPPALRARILAEARLAIAPPPWPHRFWAWLARPVPAGALSSLLLAGFIGLMWRDGPPPQGTMRPPAVAQAPLPSPVPPVDPQAASREPAARAAEPVAPSRPSAAPGPERAAAEPPAGLMRRSRQQDDPVAPSSADPSPHEKQADADGLSQKAAPLAAAPQQRAPQQRASAPEPVAPAPSMSESHSESPSMPTPTVRRQAPAGLTSPPLLGSADAPGARSVRPDPLAASVAAWRAVGPEGAEPRRWWLALHDQTQGRWREAEPVAGADSLLLLGPGGEPLGRLRWEPTAVRWQATGDARGWRAELSAAEIEQLRATMPR
jgi:hypothetical protein